MPCKPDRPARENVSPSASDNIRKAVPNPNEPYLEKHHTHLSGKNIRHFFLNAVLTFVILDTITVWSWRVKRKLRWHKLNRDCWGWQSFALKFQSQYKGLMGIMKWTTYRNCI